MELGLEKHDWIPLLALVQKLRIEWKLSPTPAPFLNQSQSKNFINGRSQEKQVLNLPRPGLRDCGSSSQKISPLARGDHTAVR